MADDAEESPPALQNLPIPAVHAAVSLTGAPVTPQQRIYFYSSDEWELFVREWATALHEDYVQVKRR